MVAPLNALSDPALPGTPVWRGVLRRYGLAALTILLFGVVRLPLETALTAKRRAASFDTVRLSASLREQIGQLGFLAALSGFRTPVADLLWIEAYTAWQRVAYGQMKVKLDTVTTLAPRNVNFWDMSAWHMAYNASVAAMEDRKEPSLTARKRRQREYFLLGKDYAERGIVHNPDAYVLYQTLANIYRYKLEDHCAAAEAFKKSAASPRAPEYEKRFAAYELSECPGHEREAWQELRRLYDLGTQEHLPTLEKRLAAMEEKLQLPQEQRVYKTAP